MSRVEFLSHCDTVHKPVLCAVVYLDDFWQYIRDDVHPARLCVGYTPDQFQAFLAYLESSYHSDDFCFEGTIWFDDGSWSARKSIMDEMSWVHYTMPEIPHYLRYQKRLSTPVTDLTYEQILCMLQKMKR